MENKRFQKNDAGFICAACGAEVLPLGKTSRNHCPVCLCSLHVDINPGDRQNECRGIMDPVKVETDPKKGFIILHRCRKCGEICRNRAAYGPGFTGQTDDPAKLIALTATTL